MYAGYKEEGDTCGVDHCHGKLGFGIVENCNCHIAPPCNRCVDNPLRCQECGWTDESEPASRIVHADGGIGMVENKPRQLDSTKIDYRTKSHTHFSQLVEGVYPEGTTSQEVEDVVCGTFGGRFEKFGGGKFRYIAYTD